MNPIKNFERIIFLYKIYKDNKIIYQKQKWKYSSYVQSDVFFDIT